MTENCRFQKRVSFHVPLTPQLLISKSSNYTWDFKIIKLNLYLIAPYRPTSNHAKPSLLQPARFFGPCDRRNHLGLKGFSLEGTERVLSL